MTEAPNTLQLQFLTETEILNCSITPTGQWVQPHPATPTREPTFQEKAHLRAAYYWLNIYRPHPQSSPQEQIQGYLDAAHHLVQIEAWDLIGQILFLPMQSERTQSPPILGDLGGLKDSETQSISLNTSSPSSAPIKTTHNLSQPLATQSTQPFHQQLGLWGFHREQIELYQTLLGKISSEVDCLCLDDLGHAYTNLCDYENAIACYQRLLNLAAQIHSQKAEVKALGGLARCHTSWGQYQTALNHCQEQLKRLDVLESGSLKNSQDTSLGDFIQIERGRTLTVLGYLAYFRRQPRRAVRYFQESLALCQPHHDHQIEWYTLGGLAIAHAQLGKHPQATAAIEEQSQKNHLNAYQINASLLNLTTAYLYQFNFQFAIDCQQKLIAQSQKNGDIRSQCYALLYIATIHFLQEQDSLAIEPLQQSLNIAQTFYYQQVESQALAILSCIYSRQRQNQKAMDYAQKSLAIAETLGDFPREKNCAHIALGFAHFAQGHFLRGLREIVTSLAILPPWNSKEGKLMLIVIFKRSKFLTL